MSYCTFYTFDGLVSPLKMIEGSLAYKALNKVILEKALNVILNQYSTQLNHNDHYLGLIPIKAQQIGFEVSNNNFCLTIYLGMVKYTILELCPCLLENFKLELAQKDLVPIENSGLKKIKQMNYLINKALSIIFGSKWMRKCHKMSLL